MSMWDNINIETEGDVHHYMNNALSVISIDAGNIAHYAKDNPKLAGIAERLQTSVNNLTLVRDAIIKQLLHDNE